MKVATKICSYSKPIVRAAKEVVNYNIDASGLQQGLQFERRMFQATFAVQDRVEGMTAFTEKRKPEWKD